MSSACLNLCWTYLPFWGIQFWPIKICASFIFWQHPFLGPFITVFVCDVGYAKKMSCVDPAGLDMLDLMLWIVQDPKRHVVHVVRSQHKNINKKWPSIRSSFFTPRSIRTSLSDPVLSAAVLRAHLPCPAAITEPTEPTEPTVSAAVPCGQWRANGASPSWTPLRQVPWGGCAACHSWWWAAERGRICPDWRGIQMAARKKDMDREKGMMGGCLKTE